MLFGNPFEKPASPQVLAAREFVKRNQHTFEALHKLTDAELNKLEEEVESLLTYDEKMRLYSLDGELADTYSGAKAAIRAERRRREDERFTTWLQHDRARSTVKYLLGQLAARATGAESIEAAKELRLPADEILGPKPETVHKLTQATVAAMTDEELADAANTARGQANATAPYVLDAERIQTALDYLAPLVTELKSRRPLLDKCRNQGEANLNLILAEQGARRSRAEAERARADSIAENAPTILAEILERLDSIEGAR